MSGERDLIEGHGGQIIEQRRDTVHRIAVGGSLGGGLRLGWLRRFGLLHRRVPHRRGLILEQQGCQTPAQVPFQVPGQQAEEHMPEHVLFGVD